MASIGGSAVGKNVCGGICVEFHKCVYLSDEPQIVVISTGGRNLV